jgi:hypothetical protein
MCRTVQLPFAPRPRSEAPTARELLDEVQPCCPGYPYKGKGPFEEREGKWAIHRTDLEARAWVLANSGSAESQGELFSVASVDVRPGGRLL